MKTRRPMLELTEAYLALMGFSLAAAKAGAIGGAWGTLAVNEPASARKWAINIVAGFFCAGFASNGIAHLMLLPARFAPALGFAIGIFGMAIASKTIEIIKLLNLEQLLSIIITKFKK